jgi:DNA-binding MarR family transcriptional regulator
VINIDRLAAQLERLMGFLHTHPRTAQRSTKAWSENGGITVPQMSALSILRDQGPLTLRALAEAVGVSAPATSQLVDRMVQNGLVSREEDTTDRRRTRLSATSKSTAVLARIGKARRDHFELALEELPPGLLRNLSAALEPILSFYEEHSPWNQSQENSTASLSRPNSKTHGSARTAEVKSAKHNTASRTPKSERSMKSE